MGEPLLKNSRFQALLWTQFLGALNGSVYKTIVAMRAVHVAANAGPGGGYLPLAGAAFVIPFLLFSGYSGYLADRISKRSVLISVKVFEMGVMGLGLAAFFSTRIELMLVVLFLMAAHSTVFSPAKYGMIPEMVPEADLSRANGLLEMTTFVAIALGTSAGVLLFPTWTLGVATIGIALVGFAASLRITRVPRSGSRAPFRINPFAEVRTGTARLLRDRALALTVLGLSYFWFLGALSLLLFGGEARYQTDVRIGLMVISFAMAAAAGSLLAGRWSGDRVELGLAPIGSIGMGLACMAFYAARTFPMVVTALAGMGLAGGLLIVPLNAYLQRRSEAGERGRILATNNFYNAVGLLLASATWWGLHGRLHISAGRLVLWFGILTLAATVLIVILVPEFLLRFALWIATYSLFKIRIVGRENVPSRGAALLVSNHMTHVDGFLIGACFPRYVRFMVWKPFYKMPVFNWLLRMTETIPVGTNGPRDMVASLKNARHELTQGHLVCIFAEGSISRTGNLLPFKRGMERIVGGLDVPVIPVHLDGLWGHPLSFSGGRFFWKWPKKLFHYPVTVSFGPPMPSSCTVQEVRQAVTELASEAVAARKSADDLLSLRFIRTARRNWSRFAMADSSGLELTYGRALAASFLLARWLHTHCASEPMVGLLLPPSVGGALANIGVAMAGKTPVNLDFTAGGEVITSTIGQCHIRTIITSKKFLAKSMIDAMEGMVFLEDLLESGRGFARLRALLLARLAPARMLISQLPESPDSPATVICSSGGAGERNGVMLSHYNIISNIEAMAQIFPAGPRDRIIGVLPFFHSFGFTVTIWFPLITGCGVAYHPFPTEAKAIGELVAKYQGTFLPATPAFCTVYARECTRVQFASLRFVVACAGTLRAADANSFREAFGLELLAGYGCAQMSGVIAVNAPDYEAGKETQAASRPGTVGNPLPGVAVRVVSPKTMEPVPPNHEGLLLVKGPNLMLGYLGAPQRTAESIEGGWYRTGDIAAIDDDGFIRIRDRLRDTTLPSPVRARADAP